MKKEYILRKVKRQIDFIPSKSFFFSYLTGYMGTDVYQEGIELMDEKGNKRIIWEKTQKGEEEVIMIVDGEVKKGMSCMGLSMKNILKEQTQKCEEKGK